MIAHSGRRLYLTLAVLFAACALITGLSTSTLFAEESHGEVEHVPPSQGASDAPITIVEYGDFQ